MTNGCLTRLFLVSEIVENGKVAQPCSLYVHCSFKFLFIFNAVGMAILINKLYNKFLFYLSFEKLYFFFSYSKAAYCKVCEQ